MRKLHNWDDWIDYFSVWQDKIGLERSELRQFEFTIKFDDPDVEAIEFGHYRGQRYRQSQGAADDRFQAPHRQSVCHAQRALSGALPDIASAQGLVRLVLNHHGANGVAAFRGGAVLPPPRGADFAGPILGKGGIFFPIGFNLSGQLSLSH